MDHMIGKYSPDVAHYWKKMEWSLRPGADSLDDFDQSTDKSRDAWQPGIQKKQNTAGIFGKRDVNMVVVSKVLFKNH